MTVIQNGTYIVRNAAQRSLVLAVNMGTIVQCMSESEIDLSKEASGYSKFQREIRFHYNPRSMGYCISTISSPSEPSKVAFPYHIDGLPDEFMFLEGGREFDHWKLLSYGNGKFSIGLPDGRILSGYPGSNSWDLQTVPKITDLQLWIFERLADPSGNISASTDVALTSPISPPGLGIRRNIEDGGNSMVIEVKRRQAQGYLERQHRVSASELLLREGIMLTNVEKGYQLGLSDSILEDGAVPTVRTRADWKNWILEPIVEKRQILSFTPKSRGPTFRLIWNRQGGYVLGYRIPAQYGHDVLYMMHSADVSPRSNKNHAESWELRQTRNGGYILSIPGSGLVLEVKDNIIRLEYARGLTAQEWIVS